MQIAVACYHLGNQNWRGTVILLGEGIRRLSPYQPDYGGIDINYLLDTSSALVSHLQQAGPERVAEYTSMILEYGSQAVTAETKSDVLPRLRQVVGDPPSPS